MSGESSRREDVITCLLALAMAAIGGLGLLTYYAGGFPSRIPEALRNIDTVPLDKVADWRLGTCLLDQHEGGPPQHFTSECIDQRRPLLFLWGDSLSAAFYPGLRTLESEMRFGIAQFSTAGCPPLLDFIVVHRPLCVGDNAAAFAKIKEVRPQIVLLFSTWGYEGNIIPYLDATIAALKAANVPRVVVMGPAPVWSGGLAKAAYDHYRSDPLHRMLPMYSDFRLNTSFFDLHRDLRQHLRQLVEYFSTWDALCEAKKCRVWVDYPGGQLTQFDDVHLTIGGADFLASKLASVLFPDR